ncbi:MAG: hypothetical protein KatS3mg002_0862 [Candidatus Woesearchaeota archaeon]|nr:MAG: hypothetical protein KatS3mg002_0862 [Candidatus Woesearchaeota archaeon]
MHKKGSMELSVNSIVILVIAVVMLGLILGFIRSKFSEISSNFIVDESTAPEATSSEPITLSRNILTLTGTKKTGLNINFYNIDTRNGNYNYNNAVPHFDCTSSGLTTQVNIIGEYFSKTATRSNMISYTGNIRLSSAVAKDTYLCRVCFAFRQTGQPAINTNEKCSNLVNDIVAEKEFQIVVR